MSADDGLPTGWVKTKISEVAELIRGVTYRKADSTSFAAPGLVPILRATNIQDRLLTEDDLVFVPKKCVSPKQYLQMGDIVIATSSGSSSVVGKSAPLQTDWPGSFGAFCAVLRAEPKVDPRYLSYFVSSSQVRDKWSLLARGTNINNLKAGDVASTVVPLPPLAEQECIVDGIEEQFSRIDAGAAALERVRKNLKRMRTAAFATIADSVDSWITLGEIADVVGGVTKDGKRQSDPSFIEVPYLRVANVQRGFLDLNVVTTIRVPPATARNLRLEPGDILFNEGGDRDKLGRGWIWEGKISDCIHQNHVFRARLRTERFEPKFVSMHGNTFGRTWFETMGKQTTNLASLNLTTLKSFPVPDLPIERQCEIVAEVEREVSLVDALELAADHSFARCDSLRSAILAAAFSGELCGGEEPS